MTESESELSIDQKKKVLYSTSKEFVVPPITTDGRFRQWNFEEKIKWVN